MSVDHAVCGAKEVKDNIKGPLYSTFAYPIIGHHSGLPDRGAEGDNADATALLARLQKECEDYSAYKTLTEEPDFSSATDEVTAFLSKNVPKDLKPYEQIREVNKKFEFGEIFI